MIQEKLTYDKIMNEPGSIFKYEPSDLMNPEIATFLWDNPYTEEVTRDNGAIMVMIADYDVPQKENPSPDSFEEGFQTTLTPSYDGANNFLGTKTEVIDISVKPIKKEDISNYVYEPSVFAGILMSSASADASKFFEVYKGNIHMGVRFVDKKKTNSEFFKSKVKSFYKHFYAIKKRYEESNS